MVVSLGHALSHAGRVNGVTERVMITRLDHIAIAVPDLQAAIERFAQDLGLELAGQEDVPSQSTTTAFLPVNGTQIELIHPINGEGPVAAYLAKRNSKSFDEIEIEKFCKTADPTKAVDNLGRSLCR